MQDLSTIGMEKGLLYETIITTKNSEEIPNAAPIGVTCKNKSEIVLYLFEGTHTLQNIKSNGHFIVNILKDPMVFVESTLGDLSSDYFESYKNDFYIKNTDAFFSAIVTNTKEVERNDKIGKSNMIVITAALNEIIIKNEGLEPLNRAIFAIIESLVYLSRINIVDDKTADKYLEHIKEMSRLVNRVGGKEHKKAMDKILEQLN